MQGHKKLFSFFICVFIVAIFSAGQGQTLPAVQSSTAPGPAAQATLLFDEEFNGNQLDLTKWYRCYANFDENVGCSNGPPYEKEWYQIANVTVSGGKLHLTAKHQSVQKGYPYTSGMVSTGGEDCQAPTCDPSQYVPPGFTFQYGYAETRAKLPPGIGMWPAFFLLPANFIWPPEIDIMEWRGEYPTIDHASLHWRGKKGAPHQNNTDYDTGVDLSAAYHSYALEWTADSIVWYFDGQPIKTYSGPEVPQEPMYIVLDLAVGGWKGPGARPPHFPATMLVDYVRVWDQKPQ